MSSDDAGSSSTKLSGGGPGFRVTVINRIHVALCRYGNVKIQMKEPFISCCSFSFVLFVSL